jgi:hypothetical protein
MNHHYCFSGEQLLFLARIASDLIFHEIFRYADLPGPSAQGRTKDGEMAKVRINQYCLQRVWLPLVSITFIRFVQKLSDDPASGQQHPGRFYFSPGVIIQRDLASRRDVLMK